MKLRIANGSEELRNLLSHLLRDLKFVQFDPEGFLVDLVGLNHAVNAAVNVFLENLANNHALMG